MMWSLLLLGLRPQVSADAIRESLARSAGSGVESSVRQLFADPKEADYLVAMAGRRGGLRRLKVSVIPAPPGYEALGPYWAVFSARQDIEEDHDPVFPIFTGPDSWKLGPEIPEDGNRELSIKDVSVVAKLDPEKGLIEATAMLKLTGAAKRAPLFRLNLPYEATSYSGQGSGRIWNAAEGVPTPKVGDLVRAGALLIPWRKDVSGQIEFSYRGIIQSENEDTITPTHAYVTAWWVPTLTRLPHPTRVKVTGPADWVLRSEGTLESSKVEGSFQTVAYKCDLPISYPKILGGKYVLAAEAEDGGKTFRSWQFAPIDEARAKKDVQLMVDAARYFGENLGAWPFPGYECFDAKGYYGIESYSYTLLAPRITSAYVTHEMGHTYFGGIVPSAYVHDSWNEGLTQYIDSVIFRKNWDRTLETGLRSLEEKTPLDRMPVPHAFGGHSYTRGAYVMRMLEAEIGPDKVLEGLKVLVKERAGKETRWADLRGVFERVGGKDLSWFWAQWVQNTVFPTVEVRSMETVTVDAPFRTIVNVAQSGSASAMKLRFKLKLTDGKATHEEIVIMKARQEGFVVRTSFKPTQAEIDVFGLSLARVKK